MVGQLDVLVAVNLEDIATCLGGGREGGVHTSRGEGAGASLGGSVQLHPVIFLLTLR
jgi:hypothetical protein